MNNVGGSDNFFNIQQQSHPPSGLAHAQKIFGVDISSEGRCVLDVPRSHVHHLRDLVHQDAHHQTGCFDDDDAGLIGNLALVHAELDLEIHDGMDLAPQVDDPQEYTWRSAAPV